ncbi:SPRY domain-containing SOCS box protein 3 [Calliopsis andreniformis]|uniref:SPRY domain-containing SOCS box protein 3 n=1 Tax=Calliopsis andreniformis TaxID=337506 RepID=UPI003FCC3764
MSFVYNSLQLMQYEKFCNCVPLSCRCGETDVYEWAWDKDHVSSTIVLSEHNLEVQFHNRFSCGTAAVRGEKPLEKGRHHYWEVKMLSPIYGTDNMIGAGTSKVDLDSAKNVFCSLLGLDQESFGFSYQGYIQHAGRKRNYGACFGQGSLVGMHLDAWRGTLEFYINRRPLGIAFTGLQDTVLYPMVCSTAARSKLRLNHSSSIPVSLQIECLAVLKPSQKEYLSAMFPTLRYLSESIFANILKKRSNKIDEKKALKDLTFLRNCMELFEYNENT